MQILLIVLLRLQCIGWANKWRKNLVDLAWRLAAIPWSCIIWWPFQIMSRSDWDFCKLIHVTWQTYPDPLPWWNTSTACEAFVKLLGFVELSKESEIFYKILAGKKWLGQCFKNSDFLQLSSDTTFDLG